MVKVSAEYNSLAMRRTRVLTAFTAKPPEPIKQSPSTSDIAKADTPASPVPTSPAPSTPSKTERKPERREERKDDKRDEKRESNRKGSHESPRKDESKDRGHRRAGSEGFVCFVCFCLWSLIDSRGAKVLCMFID